MDRKQVDLSCLYRQVHPMTHGRQQYACPRMLSVSALLGKLPVQLEPALEQRVPTALTRGVRKVEFLSAR